MKYKIGGNIEDGLILLIDKPGGYSSARVVNIIKNKLKVKKAGHSGTLDPMATGLMIVCTQRMTKQLKNFLECDKEYEGKMLLGETTNSYDSETRVQEIRPIDHVTDEMILENTISFIGEIDQVPPMYSAVKYKGKPLYKYARKNTVIERASKKVLIKEFSITDISLPEVSFRTVCSKGTYIRSLVNDFGEKLGTGAHLKQLRRLKIGIYEVVNAISLEDFIKLEDNLIYN
jgi:tRNA pseudouridine55 synthase